jgi:hypothetical protein
MRRDQRPNKRDRHADERVPPKADSGFSTAYSRKQLNVGFRFHPPSIDNCGLENPTRKCALFYCHRKLFVYNMLREHATDGRCCVTFEPRPVRADNPEKTELLAWMQPVEMTACGDE